MNQEHAAYFSYVKMLQEPASPVMSSEVRTRMFDVIEKVAVGQELAQEVQDELSEEPSSKSPKVCVLMS